MKKSFKLLTLLLLFSHISFAQIPKIGKPDLLDIACWNIEWFGDVTNGPSNEVTQFNNVKSFLAGTDIDVWALEEVSEPTAWANLTAALPAYGNTITTYTQTQKTALLWKKSLFDLVSSQSVLTDVIYDNDFAGRPPLEVVLTTNFKPVKDTIYFYVVHLKAYADIASYTRRKNAAYYLKQFLDANRKNKMTIVLGDWNDDLNSSITTGQPSPFLNLLNDSNNYFFITKSLSDAGKSSYITGGHMIDETMLTIPMRNFYINNSSRVLDTIKYCISNYTSNNTSDHYPIMGFYHFNGAINTAVDEVKNESHFTIFPNPLQSGSDVIVYGNVNEIKCFDNLGRIVNIDLHNTSNGNSIIHFNENMRSGIYFIELKNEDKTERIKLLIQN